MQSLFHSSFFTLQPTRVTKSSGFQLKGSPPIGLSNISTTTTNAFQQLLSPSTASVRHDFLQTSFSLLPLALRLFPAGKSKRMRPQSTQLRAARLVGISEKVLNHRAVCVAGSFHPGQMIAIQHFQFTFVLFPWI